MTAKPNSYYINLLNGVAISMNGRFAVTSLNIRSYIAKRFAFIR